MSFLDDEKSIDDSSPRDCIELIQSLAQTYRFATGTRGVKIAGQTYVAFPSAREGIQLSTSDNQADLIIRLPMRHALPQRWFAMRSPPQQLVANLYRYQLTSNEYRRIWSGTVTSISSADNNAVALLRVPSRATAMLDRRLPTITGGRACPHILYDRNCRVPRNYVVVVNTTVTQVNGRVITVATMNGVVDDWAQYGEVVHTASGERMVIYTQVGTTITMQLPIVELKVGDAVQVFAGCAHDIGTCVSKFNNRVNFGGFPQMQIENPVQPTGLGVYTSA